MDCIWHKDCSPKKHCAICRLAKKIHPKSDSGGPAWWSDWNIKPHAFVPDKESKVPVHMAVDDMTRSGKKYRPLCEPYVPAVNLYGYTRNPDKVTCEACQEHNFEGTDAKALREEAERLEVKRKKKARIAAKRARRSGEEAERKKRKKLRKGKKRKV